MIVTMNTLAALTTALKENEQKIREFEAEHPSPSNDDNVYLSFVKGSSLGLMYAKQVLAAEYDKENLRKKRNND